MDIRVSVNLAFFEKIWLFLSTHVLAMLVTKLSLGFCNQKRQSNVLKKCQIHSNSRNSKEKLNCLLQIQILHFKNVLNLPSLSLARFFLIQNESRELTDLMYMLCPQDFNRMSCYSVGMVMKHRKYNYNCVIYGWDPICKATKVNIPRAKWG